MDVDYLCIFYAGKWESSEWQRFRLSKIWNPDFGKSQLGEEKKGKTKEKHTPEI